jgi:hypothetical protein
MLTVTMLDDLLDSLDRPWTCPAGHVHPPLTLGDHRPTDDQMAELRCAALGLGERLRGGARGREPAPDDGPRGA